MSEKVCPSGHVYKGTRCDRDNWEEPVNAEASAPETAGALESKSVRRRVAATKSTEKKVSGKKAPKAKAEKKTPAKKSKKSKK